MTEEYTITLDKIIQELSLEEIYLPCESSEILIRSRDVNRPGMELHGFTDFFDDKRINLLGISEMAMFQRLEPQERQNAIEAVIAAVEER